MVEPAESREGLNLAFTRSANFCRPTCWRVLRESKMSSVLVIVGRRGIERGVARGSGTVAERNRIVERAHQGIRRADGENRQGELPASRAAQTGEGSRNTDRADVCPDPRRPASVREESRGRMFSRVKTWAQGLRAEPAADAHHELVPVSGEKSISFEMREFMSAKLR